MAAMLDLIIEGGSVVDGTGAPPTAADVGVLAGRIAAVGDLSQWQSRSRVSARGRVVAPGFIDVHTHDDRLLLDEGQGAHPKLSQGVTTVITGNCGVSLAPLVLDSAATPPAPLDILSRTGWTYASFADYLDALDAVRPVVNAACLVGHTTLRVRHVADLTRRATPEECARMAADLQEGLRAGAVGLSTGLYYPPAQAADLAEVVAVGAGLHAAKGLITMHIRDESDAIDSAIDEALEIGRQLAVPTVLSHHKLVGSRNHGRSRETLARIEQAARLQPVCLDCYPYNASSTMLLASRIRLSREVIVTWSATEPEVAGQSLFALATERGLTPEELAARLQPAGAIYFAMAEEDVQRILAHPLTMVGSDGLAHDEKPHPRLWGTFARVLGHYVRDLKILSMPEAIRKMTALCAERFGLDQRGVLAPGFHADIVVFDPARIIDHATYERPQALSGGIEHVYVNGQLAWADGQPTGARAGQVLRGGRSAA